MKHSLITLLFTPILLGNLFAQEAAPSHIKVEPALLFVDYGLRPQTAISFNITQAGEADIFETTKAQVTARDATGQEIGAQVLCDFQPKRALCSIKFDKQPQGSWVDIQGEIQVGLSHEMETHYLPLTQEKGSLRGEDFEVTYEKLDDKRLMVADDLADMKTKIYLIDAEGKEVISNGMQFAGKDGNKKRFIYSCNGDCSTYRLRVERARPTNIVRVPLNKRVNISGIELDTATPAPALAQQPGGKCGTPESSQLQLTRYILTKRPGVFNNYEGADISVRLTPPAGRQASLRLLQPFTLQDEKGRSIPPKLTRADF